MNVHVKSEVLEKYLNSKIKHFRTVHYRKKRMVGSTS